MDAPVDVAQWPGAGRGAGITHLAIVHHETTTGRLNDLALSARCAGSAGIRLLLDAVSSFGAEASPAMTGTSAHSRPPPTSACTACPGCRSSWPGRTSGPAACRAGSLYFDLHGYHRTQHRDGFSPFTQAVQVAFALREALAEHAEEGGSESRRLSYAARAARIAGTLRDAGIETLLPPGDFSSVLWSWRLPPGMTYARLHDGLKARRFRHLCGAGASWRGYFPHRPHG